MTLRCLVWERKAGYLLRLSISENVLNGANRELPEDMLKRYFHVPASHLLFHMENEINQDINMLVDFSCKIAKLKMGAQLLKCKKIFYIIIDISSVSAYNKSEEMEGGHRNEV